MMEPLTLAIPKGRLLKSVLEFFETKDLNITFKDRQLKAIDSTNTVQVYQVKNHDLPAYVLQSVTGMGISGDDNILESGLTFTRLMKLPFGSTRLCLCARRGELSPLSQGREITVATSYVQCTRRWFHSQGIPVNIIKLAGSVELAPVMDLAPYIVDLVETGDTLRANGLEIVMEMLPVNIRLIANPAYFKIYFRKINELIEKLK